MNKTHKNTLIYFLTTLSIAGLLAYISTFLNYDFSKFSLVLPQLAPLIGLIIIKVGFSGECIKVKPLRKDYLLLTVFVILPFLFALIVNGFTGSSIPLFSIRFIPALGIVLGSIGEEVGWRGFMQPELEKRHNPFVSSLIVGFFWAIWHVSHFANGLLFMLLFIGFCISFSIITAYSVRGRKNLLAPIVLHSTFNYIGFQIGEINSIEMKVYFICFIIFAVITLFLKRTYFFKLSK